MCSSKGGLLKQPEMQLDENIQTLAPVSELYYFDTQSILIEKPLTALEAWNIAMANPLPLMGLAFKIRDAVSGCFGVKRIGGFSNVRRASVCVGDKLDFFLVEGVTPDSLVLTERDTHLDVMTCISTLDTKVTITSSVVVHNTFGRVYMVPVGLAHKVIVRSTLKRLKSAVS